MILYSSIFVLLFCSGILADDNGNSTCPENEVESSCKEGCIDDYCPTSRIKSDTGCSTERNCVSPCTCRFNYKRNECGKCIPTRECPAFDCGPNEVYKSCPPRCPTDDCSMAQFNGECPPLLGHILIVLECNPSCRCQEGYWRLNGTCVPVDQCPSSGNIKSNDSQ